MSLCGSSDADVGTEAEDDYSIVSIEEVFQFAAFAISSGPFSLHLISWCSAKTFQTN